MSECTSLEYFNLNLKYFINDIIATFPEYKDVLELYYDDVLEDNVCSNDKYVKRFMRKLSEFKTLISNKDNELFSNSVLILKNVDFKTIWQSEELSEDNRERVWEYIQTLFVIGESILSDSSKVKSIVRSFQKFREGEEITEEANANGEEATENVPTDNGIEASEGETTEDVTTEGVTTEDDVDPEILNMLKNLSKENKDKPLPENIFENGLIGKLAQELSDEINLDDMNLGVDENTNVDDIFSKLLSGNNPMKFMNLLQTVGSKIQNKVQNSDLDQGALVDEATKMMAGLQGGQNSLFDNLLRQAGNMAGAAQNQGASNIGNANNSHGSSNPTRDRLRRKLEKRRQNKE